MKTTQSKFILANMESNGSSNTNRRTANCPLKSPAVPGSDKSRHLKAVIVGITAATTIAGTLHAAAISVPNASFESPDIVFASSLIDSWQKFPGSDQATGLFDNTPTGSVDHIDNVDGAQVGFVFAAPGVGLFQDLSGTFEVGMSYDLTLGIIGGGGGAPEGAGFEISLFFRDGLNAIVPIGSTPIVYNPANFPTTTHLIDYAVQLSPVQASDAWAGQNIGVRLLSTSGTGVGYWDVDNLRLTTVPEPATPALLVLGAGGLLMAYRRRRRRS
jgi:hypothetical protein